MDSSPKPAATPRVKNLGSGIKGKGYRVKLQTLYYKFFYGVFGLAESIFGPSIIPLFAIPFIGIDLARRERDLSQFERLRNALPAEFWQDVTPRKHYYRMVRNWADTGAVVLLQHRLGLPRWQKRFQVSGTPPQEHPDWGKRPVVLTFLHTGTFALLLYWLRSRGIPAAMLVGGIPFFINNDAFRKIMAIGDQRNGLEDVPHIFQRYNTLREVIRFLTPGHALLMALDGGKRVDEVDTYDAGGFPIVLKRGAFRLAAQKNAILIPISARRTGMCRFEIHFGKPVPDELLRNGDRAAATQHLVSELWPGIAENPSDLNWTTLEAIAPQLRTGRTGWP
jgi:lauroyl/myristoyl acyltransferase